MEISPNLSLCDHQWYLVHHVNYDSTDKIMLTTIFKETAWNDLYETLYTYRSSTIFERIINFKHREFNFDLMNETLQGAPILTSTNNRRQSAIKSENILLKSDTAIDKNLQNL